MSKKLGTVMELLEVLLALTEESFRYHDAVR